MNGYPLHVLVFYYLGLNATIMASVYAAIFAVSTTVRRLRNRKTGEST